MLLMALAAVGQTISGTLRDSSTNEPLSYAIVSLYRLPDSALISANTTDTLGKFTFGSVPKGRYLLLGSMMSYRPLKMEVDKQQRNLDLGMIVMAEDAQMLSEVEVTAQMAPMVVKEDTVEFNAGAFKTGEGAVAEDLLRKLPSVEVDKDGNIKAVGKDVTRILVDGKPFFGNDPQLATKNLPADAIDKVQVYEKRSDQSAFTGFNDGSGEQVIDIKLKPDRRRGKFGKVTGGVGTDSRFMGGANYNSFQPGKQISGLVAANNTNQSNFTFRELQDAGATDLSTGGGRRWGGGGGGNNGIATTYSGGINFTREFNPRFNISGNYFYNFRGTDLEQSSFDQNLLRDTTIYNVSELTRQVDNQNHRTRLDFEWKPDSLNTWNWKNNFAWSDRQSVEDKLSTSSYYGTTDTLNSGTTTGDSRAQSPDIATQLVWRHKFLKQGRTLSADLNAGSNYNETISLNTSQWVNTAQLIGNGLNFDQSSNRLSRNTTASAKLAYTESFGKKNQMEATYQYNFARNALDRETSDYDTLAKAYTAFNDLLSNAFVTDWNTHRTGLSMRHVWGKSDLQIGAIYQLGQLNNENAEAEQPLYRVFQAILPNINYSRTTKSNANIRVRLDGRMQQPSVNQLQPIIENSNPQFLRLGNPDLEPSTQYNLSFNYHKFNKTSNRSGYGNIWLNYTDNAIIDSTIIKSNGQQILKPINARNAIGTGAYVGFGIPLKGNDLSLRLNAGGNISQAYTLINDVEGTALYGSTNPSIGLSYNLRDSFNADINLGVGYNFSQNPSLQQATQELLNYSASANFTWKLRKGWQLESDVSYRHFDANIGTTSQDITLWNAGLSKNIIKNRDARLKLQVLDLLNQNLAIERFSSGNSISESRYNALQRYALITFTYKFGTNPNQKQGGPPFMHGPGGGGGRGSGGGGRGRD